MSFSTRTGFNPITVLGWIRSEIAENYRPARSRELMSDPWWQADMDYATAWAGVQGVSW